MSATRGITRVAAIALLVALNGCQGIVPVGTDCDELAARSVVYDQDGIPAYAGQAYVISTCASCHAADSPSRGGAPRDRTYGLRLALGSGDRRVDELSRLFHEQTVVYAQRDEVYTQIVRGDMPPSGYPTLPRYEDATGTHVPDLRSSEAHEIVRNWLACGAPVVESTSSEPSTCDTDTDCVVTNQCNPDLRECVGVGDVVPALAP